MEEKRDGGEIKIPKALRKQIYEKWYFLSNSAANRGSVFWEGYWHKIMPVVWEQINFQYPTRTGNEPLYFPLKDGGELRVGVTRFHYKSEDVSSTNDLLTVGFTTIENGAKVNYPDVVIGRIDENNTPIFLINPKEEKGGDNIILSKILELLANFNPQNVDLEKLADITTNKLQTMNSNTDKIWYKQHIRAILQMLGCLA